MSKELSLYILENGRKKRSLSYTPPLDVITSTTKDTQKKRFNTCKKTEHEREGDGWKYICVTSLVAEICLMRRQQQHSEQRKKVNEKRNI